MGQVHLPQHSVRQACLTLLFFITAINYLDRQSLSVVASLLRRELSFSTIGYSHVVFLFLLGYTIGQVLDGKIIDKIGARVGMVLCVALWSVTSILHSLAAGVVSLGILRFLLGLAEAGNWPGGVKAVAENFPPKRRAFATGVFNSGSSLGAILAPPLVVAVVDVCGWRSMFVVTGAIGLIWISLWVGTSHNQAPLHEPRGLNALPPQRAIRALLRERAVWGLMVGRFLTDPVWWFYAFWLPEYLVQSRGFSLANIGHTAWIPFVFAGAGGWLGGFASDVLTRRGLQPVLARKIVMVTGAMLMLCGIPAYRVESGTLALALISVVVFGFTAWSSNILSLAIDLFAGDLVGQVTGLGGTSAALGGMLFTLATGWLVQNVSYASVFIVSSAMSVFAVGAIIWLIPSTHAYRAT